MRVKIDATPDELSEKGDALIKALMHSISPVCPELAEQLEKALPEKEPTLRYRVLRDIHEITKKEYQKTLEAMHLDIARVLDAAANATSAGQEFTKAMGPFIGPRGGKWADPQHTIHWEEAVPHEQIVEQAHAAVKEHVTEGAMRAAAVGADAPSLKYVGAGGEGMIFEDGQGRAYKVSRQRSAARPDWLRNEAEAMQSLEGTPVAHLVPKVHGYDPTHDVITRDMISGSSAGWGQSSKLREKWDAISTELEKQGWTAPEFKEDSFIIPPGGGDPIMIDMGFVHPIGKRLATALKARVENPNPKDDWFDFQLDVSHAYQDNAIDLATAMDYLTRGGAGIEGVSPEDVAREKKEIEFTARMKGDLKAGQTWHDIPKPEEPKPKRKPGKKSGEELRRAQLLQDGYSGPVEADAPLAKAEETIRGQEHEHAAIYDAEGKMLFRLTSGMVDACAVSPVHANRIKENGNVTFTHNHPKNGCVSLQDIALTVHLNIKEMRAVCTNGVTFVLTRPEGGWEQRGDWRTLFTAATNLGNGRASARMDDRIRKAGGKPGYPDSLGFSEEVWDGFRHEEGFKAIKEAADGLGWGFRSEGTKRSVADPGGDPEKRDQPGQGQPGDLPGAVAPKRDEPQVGDKVPVTVHPTITGRDEEAHPYRVVGLKDGQVQLSRHEGSDYGPKMPVASLKHFQNDLAGKVDLPPSGNPDIDAVTSGKAKLLGKGDDGLAFKVGDKVVKVSTTVPYQPENPGHRSPEEAVTMLKKQVDTANEMADAGVPGIQRSEFVQHGDKGFQIKPWVEIPEKFTREQLDAVQDTIIAMHKKGYALHDEPQAGLDAEGKPVMFDVGKAEKDAGDPQEWRSPASFDMENLKFLYQKHGQEFVRRDFSEGEKLWDHFKNGVDKWMDPKKPNPGFARYNLKHAVDALSKEARATLTGPELETRLAKIKSEAQDHIDLWGLDKEPTKAPEAPKAPPLELTPEPAPKPKPKRTPVLAKPPEEEAAKPLPGQLSLLGGPPVPGKRKVRKPVQHVLFAELEKQKPEDKPLPGQQKLFKSVLIR